MKKELQTLGLLIIVLLSGLSLLFSVRRSLERPAQNDAQQSPRVLAGSTVTTARGDEYYLYNQEGVSSTISSGNTARITFCKVMIDGSDDIIGPELPAGTTFSIRLYIDPTPKYPELPDNRGPVWKQITFSPPYVLNRDLLYQDGINDAFCAGTDAIPVEGEMLDIAYDQETINSNLGWSAPEYNDQFTHSVVNLNDFFTYSNQLYDGIPGNEEQRDKNADGHVVLGPQGNRIVVILNRTSYVAPEPTPTEPTITIVPTSVPTITSEPTPATSITPNPSVSITPTGQIREVLTLDTAELQVASNCSQDNIEVLAVKVRTSGQLAKFEYSVDAGKSWNLYDLGGNHFSQEINFSTAELGDNIYSIRFRATSASGIVRESEALTHAHNCSGRIVILGNYYKNGFNHALLNDDGYVLYNPSLELKLFAETLTPVEQLYLRLGAKATDLATNPVQVLKMQYDFKAELWSITIPAELLEQQITYAGLSVSPEKDSTVFVKEIAPVLNVDNVAAREAGYEYQLFSKTGSSWQQLDYARELNSVQTQSYQLFNLYPSEYYFGVRFPSGQKYYSEKFKLDVPSVVKVDTATEPRIPALAVIDPYLRNLEIVSVSKLAEPEFFEQVQVSPADNYNLYAALVHATELDQEERILFVYWNRWNPYFDEQNQNYINLNELLGSLPDNAGKLVLLTDKNSFDELQRSVLIRRIDATVILVDNDEFLNAELRYQPEVVVWDKSEPSLKRIRGNNNLYELRVRLNELNYF